MNRRFALVVGLLLLANAGGSRGGQAGEILPGDGPPAPVCRAGTVVDVMTRTLATRAHYVRLDASLIQEAPTSDGRVVECGVCALIFQYDMPRYGEQAVARCEPHVFSVLAVRNGYVVRLVR